jgi:hypothetical protein
MEIFLEYSFDGTLSRVPHYYVERQNPVSQDPLLEDFENTGFDFNAEVRVHKKYINHFFRNDPAGAQRALRQYIEWLSSADTLCRRAMGERWETEGGVYSVHPFIQAFLDVGAKLKPLHEFIQSISVEEDEDEEEDAAERRRELKEHLLRVLKEEMRPERMRENAWKRRKNAVMAFAKAKENERRQSNSRRRKTRKGQRKNRRATRRSRRNY